MSKLEELLNLPESKKIIEEDTIDNAPKDPPALFRDISDLDKISAALPFVRGLGDETDKEFDELARRALNAYDDLMDLGMNVEARYSSRVFEVASSMLKNAIDAKSAKADKKIKMIEMQLKKQKLDTSDSTKNDQSMTVQSEGYVISDRNSLIEKLKSINIDK